MKHSRTFPVAVVSALVLLCCALVRAAGAQAAPHCEPDRSPQFVFGFANLKAQLGDAMGEPVSCEYADPNGTGDTLQDTTRGLAFWRKSTNTPTFTDGATHWALADAGLLTWTGASIDPPAVALQPPAPPTPAAPAPAPSAPQPPAPAVPAPAGTCGAPQNPWGYTFCGGSVIAAPPTNFCSFFHCIASFWNQTNGYVVECSDGLFTHSGGVRGSCSSHGGNKQTLYQG